MQDSTAALLGLGEDCTLDDFLKIVARGKLLTRIPITLPASEWIGTEKPFTQIITVSGVLGDETKQAIWPTPAINSIENWNNAGIIAVNQQTDLLTFQCQKRPTSNIYGHVFILGVKSDYKYIPKTLNDCPWELISELSASGEIKNYFNVGDTKTIKINGKVGNTMFNNVEIDAFIVGFDHNVDLESPGQHRTHFQIGKINGDLCGLVDNYYNTSISTAGFFNMNISDTNEGGWLATQMRSNILGGNGTPMNPTANTLMSALPSDLRSIMKSVTKYTDNVGGVTNKESSVTSTTEYLTFPSEFEHFGQEKYANSYEKNKQKMYDYYIMFGDRMYNRYNDSKISCAPWLRSICRSTSSFCMVNVSGEKSNSIASNSIAISPLFFV